jgi:hypothetical protein
MEQEHHQQWRLVDGTKKMMILGKGERQLNVTIR